MVATIRDVADRAGVSIQTVSNVMHGRSARVAEETNAKVLAAIAALGYRPNAAARHLRRAPVGVLALAIPDLLSPYFTEVGTLIVAEATAHGYTMLLDYTYRNREQELLAAAGLRPHLIDGLILDAQCLTSADLQAGQLPIVLLGEHVYDGPYDHVVLDNVAAARLATDHLIALGRRRIAAIGLWDPPASGPARLRLQGYLEALNAAGIAPDPQLQAHAFKWHRAPGAAAMNALLALPEPPDAVFCFADLLAVGAISALHQAGMRIPEDVAVVGFDDLDEARFTVPPLTTISPDKAAIGRLSVDLLIQRITGTRTGPAERFEPNFGLVVRQSTVGAHAPVAVQATPDSPHGVFGRKE